MDMQDLDVDAAVAKLNEIMHYELAGVVRYTHSALMVRGPFRAPIVQFMQEQATESLQHAQQAGEILTGLGGHPDQGIAPIEETNNHAIIALLNEALGHEQMALGLYKELLGIVADSSVYLEEYARGMIGQEELHTMELKKMLRDYES
jgi:bacterioferritin